MKRYKSQSAILHLLRLHVYIRLSQTITSSSLCPILLQNDISQFPNQALCIIPSRKLFLYYYQAIVQNKISAGSLLSVQEVLLPSRTKTITAYLFYSYKPHLTFYFYGLLQLFYHNREKSGIPFFLLCQFVLYSFRVS